MNSLKKKKEKKSGSSPAVVGYHFEKAKIGSLPGAWHVIHSSIRPTDLTPEDM